MEWEEFFALEIGRLWLEERVSCPHRNLLQAFVEGRGSIEPAAREFVAFHVGELPCPACRVEVEDLKGASLRPSPPLPRVPPPPAGTAKRLLTETQLRERSRGK
ncbi:MAG TPA: hypothetical protein VFI25_08760 [Planctomycetota bacterium]|nr:hypothetical protein [Planctomycetota bacterium]